MRKTLSVVGIILIAILFTLTACESEPATVPATPSTPVKEQAPPTTPTTKPIAEPESEPAVTEPEPAPEFEVISLEIIPTEVTAGEAAEIKAIVKNVGGSAGTHAVILSVDGVTAEVKETALIIPGSSTVVNFSLIKDTPGTYSISVGESTSKLVVKAKLVAEKVELKYDDGRPDGNGFAIGGTGGGYLVQFSPPSTPFTMTGVKIFGKLYGTGYEKLTFDVQIWDSELKEIYSASYPHTEFSASSGWVVIDVPSVDIGDNFYIHVVTNTPREGGILVYSDSSVPNEHSEVTRNWEIADWYLSAAKGEINWMIRVTGTYIAPAD